VIHENDIEIWKRHSTNELREGPQITQMSADSSDSAGGGIAADVSICVNAPQAHESA